MNQKLIKGLKGHKALVFLDFEGTQFSHEMIAIGAISCLIDVKSGQIKKKKAPFKIYVRAHNKIGGYVEKLTGINEAILREKGVSFDTAMKSLKKYIGLPFKKATFITFGNHDMRILAQSIAYNMTYPKDITSQIQKNYFDFASFISEFIRDENGNAMSVVDLCELFKIQEAGVAHDPEVDAVNLANIYEAFIENKPLVVEEYMRHLKNHSNQLPPPIQKAVAKLAAGEDVSAAEFEQNVKDYIN